MFWIHKHGYVNTGRQPMPNLAPSWVEYECLYCADVSGLFESQLRRMPSAMAKCPNGRRVGIFEFLGSLLTGSLDCVANPAQGPPEFNPEVTYPTQKG